MPCSISKALIEKTKDFHGHWCPGLAIGIRAAELAIQELGPPEKTDLVAVVETDMCGVDAIQVLTGCTFGKGNLIHRDYGKMAFSFFDRKGGKGFRALFNPGIQGETGKELRALMKKAADGTISDQEQKRSEELRKTLPDTYLNAGLKEMFSVTKLPTPAPRPARVLQSLACETCGEMTMESRTRRYEGRTLCIPCFAQVDQKI
ncbi:MAG: formylmethanofuran dehydrogenase [Deltaproteobacteria bacterium RBG_13_43_22]|nr:MAG: formylmethanofuran dehydrogenase [Deltaproteobacteria bacterium RBG_13_43_22]